MYNNLLNQFRRTLELVRMVSYENDLNKRRRKITFHSFRRFVTVDTPGNHSRSILNICYLTQPVEIQDPIECPQYQTYQVY
jgi:hypothetical protein